MSELLTKAAVLREPNGQMLVEDVSIGDPGPDEVRVRIAGVGICHTDLIVRDRVMPVPLPLVLGHEGSGTVESVGVNVSDIEPGDAVVLSFMSCGHCPQCEGDASSYCRDFGPLNFLGGRGDGSTAYSTDGGPIHSHFFGQSSFAHLAIAHRNSVVKVRSSLSLELLGPLGCGVQTGAGAIFNALDCQAGSSVAIFGAGSVGMSAVMAARVRDLAKVVVIEPVASRRELALQLGATHVVDPAEVADVGQAIRSIVPDGVDAALDVTGISAVIEIAIGSLTRRGICALVGAPHQVGQTFDVRLGTFLQNGTRLIAVMEGESTPATFIPYLLDLQAAGKFPFERLITTYPFDQIETAIADQISGKALKPVLVIKSALA